MDRIEADLNGVAGQMGRSFVKNTGVMENGLVSPSVEGTPQGGPLSPLLSNLVLDELDRELEARGHRFVRYADDCNIYIGSERAGQRVMESVKRFITGQLKLKVNESKSAVARPQQRKFLGFSFTGGKELKRKIAPKAIERFKERVREITLGGKGRSMEQVVEELARYIRGWKAYYGFCETFGVAACGLMDPEARSLRFLAAVEDRPQAVCGTGSARG